MRNVAPNHNVSINLVSPWIVNTPWLTPPLQEVLDTHGLPVADMTSVARGVAHIVTNNWNGKSLFVGGEKFIELEGGIDAARKEWLGKEFDELAGKNKLYADQMRSIIRNASGW